MTSLDVLTLAVLPNDIKRRIIRMNVDVRSTGLPLISQSWNAQVHHYVRSLPPIEYFECKDAIYDDDTIDIKIIDRGRMIIKFSLDFLSFPQFDFPKLLMRICFIEKFQLNILNNVARSCYETIFRETFKYVHIRTLSVNLRSYTHAYRLCSEYRQFIPGILHRHSINSVEILEGSVDACELARFVHNIPETVSSLMIDAKCLEGFEKSSDDQWRSFASELFQYRISAHVEFRSGFRQFARYQN